MKQPSLHAHDIMKENNITIPFIEYDQIDELDELYRSILLAARESIKHAHAPYSKFRVGAALLTESGKIISGSNQENASFPIGACAEKVAIYLHQMTTTADPIVAIAVTAVSDIKDIPLPISPCGSCRQILGETQTLQGKPIQLLLQGSHGPIYFFTSVTDMLPFGFSAEDFI